MFSLFLHQVVKCRMSRTSGRSTLTGLLLPSNRCTPRVCEIWLTLLHPRSVFLRLESHPLPQFLLLCQNNPPAARMPHSYARAKFIGEGMLAMASAEMGMAPCLSVIGQNSGDADRDTRNATDSVPALLKGCLALSTIPTD